MSVEQIEMQWSRIDASKIESGFHSIRISPESIPELYLGVDQSGTRNLILSVPRPVEFRFKGTEKENLSIDFFTESNHIVLKLANPAFSDLFNDLILSLYNKIYTIRDPKQYGEEFIQAFHRWSGFFSNTSTMGLSEDSLKGIFGELILLKDMLEKSDSLSINNVLESWKGPYDALNDFESDSDCIEVKTKEDSKLQIRISSEFQLSPRADKTLSLCIVSVITDPIKGISLNSLVSQMRELIWERNGDMGILISALAKKGLINQNLKQYEYFRLRPLKMTFYDCDKPTFPKIIPENIANAISKVSYELNIVMLAEFMTIETTL